jgi:H+/Cl- antiporter ClcA
MAAAFGAPIGGLLYAVEQVSSWFGVKMLWHAAVASGVALYMTLIWKGTELDPGETQPSFLP